MLEKINPAGTPAWKKMKEHYEVMKDRHMRDLFQEDPDRFSRFSVRHEDLLLDFSKNIITDITVRLKK